MDKAGEPFWSEFWSKEKLPPPINLSGRGPRAWFYQEFHRLWQAHLPRAPLRTLRLLEVGCAQSRWLPYFAREWGFEIVGLDYSRLGCELARAILAREGVTGEILHQDLFAAAPGLLGSFDAVFSNGVVEHFDDPAAALRQMAAFLKPGGLLLTIVPNFSGWLGTLQGILGPEILDLHVPFRREDLAAAHLEAGLAVRFCDYLAFLHFSVLYPGKIWGKWGRQFMFKLLKGATGLGALVRRLFREASPTRRTAGFIVCIAAKPPDQQGSARLRTEQMVAG